MPPFTPVTIRYTPARLVIVTAPKVGSTTLLSTFVTLAGFGTEGASDPRKFLRGPGNMDKVREAGLFVEDLSVEEIANLQAQSPDDAFVAIMRDPTLRLVSGYFNKMNRYCKRFNKPVYTLGKFRQFLAGPRYWDDINCGNKHMRKRVPIEDFVATFEQNGTDWDGHFASQSLMNGIGKISYDRVILLNELDDALPRLLAERGVSADALAELPTLPRLNSVSGSGAFANALSPGLKARIADLYKEDCANIEKYRKL